jgi:hypothetical protein
VTAVVESRNLEKLDLATLFGKLKELELELHCLQINKEMDKKKRGLALTSSLKDDSDEEGSKDESEQVLNLLVKKFNKFTKKDDNKSFKKKFPKKGDSSTSSSKVCFECGKPGHIKTDCPTLKDKVENKGKKSHKKKRAYIAWEDNDLISSSSSSSN